MDKDLLDIISAGTMAPSADNIQPWRFEYGPGFIDLFNIPERDYSLGNWGQRPSYIAHGAVLENMAIASEHKGYRMTAKTFPALEKPDLVARCYLERGTSATHPLYDSIWKRATNRRPYRDTPLSAEQLDHIQGLTVQDASVLIVTDSQRRTALGRQVALFERVLFEDRRMHGFFFDHVNWTDEQDRSRRFGFSIKTFELPPPVKVGFSVFRHYPAMKVLNAIGMSAMIAKTNGGLYASGAGIGAITIPNRDATNFIAAGRLLQRIWLTATSFNLALQPLMGITLLMNRISADDATLAKGHAQLIANAYGEITNILNTQKQVVSFLFRIGHAEPPSARTPRLDPQVSSAAPQTT